MGVGGGALVVACAASGIAVRGGGWFVEAEFVTGVSVTGAGALLTFDGLFVDDVVVVSFCWLHPQMANPIRALAIAT
jgi:hypothetical protein